MRLLLINNNPAVSRLIKLSVEKVGYEMDEFDDYGLVPLKNYDVIMVDNELYDETELTALGEHVGCKYFLSICQRGSKKSDFVNASLEKPFLPTDFLSLLEKIKNVVLSSKEEEPKMEVAPLLVNNETHQIDAFDIDGIDAFDTEEDDEEFDFTKRDVSDELLTFEDDDELELQTFDLDDKEEDLELPFSNSSSTSDENADADEDEELEAFDFDEDEKDTDEEKSDDDILDETTSSILDKDDIDEVKQLLNESDDLEENEESEFSLDSLEEDEKEEEDKEELTFVEDITEKEIDEHIVVDNILDSKESNQEFDALDETFEETQEDIIDDFADDIEEKIEEENTVLSLDVEMEKQMTLDSTSVESLDDLNENLIKKAFGEEIEDIPAIAPLQSSQEIEVIRGEIENSIARSISGFAQSDILREALRGMKINISITFDEKS